jgi:hypothetical protein
MKRALKGAVVLLSLSVPALAQHAPSLGSSCQVRLSGADYPSLVPEYLAWQALFDEIRGEESRHAIVNAKTLGQSEYDLVVVRVAALREQVAILETRYADRQPRTRDAEIAEAIIDARDDLIRSLPIRAYLIVKTALEAVKRQTFIIPASGRLVPIKPKGSGCQVVTRGGQYPHLIRESFYWRFYFRAIAGAAERFRRGPNDYAPAHIAAVRNSLPIPIPWQYLTRLLEAATRMRAKVEDLPNSLESDAVADLIAEEVRDQLIRDFPKVIWLAVKADASRARAGAFIAFPPK